MNRGKSKVSHAQNTVAQNHEPACGGLYWTGNTFSIWQDRPLAGNVAESRAVYGSSLGLHLYDTGAIIACLKTGLAIDAFERLSEAIGVAPQRLAELANIAARTFARRKKEGRLPFAESERVFRLAALFEKATEVLGDTSRAQKWFKTPLNALGGKAPLDFADTEVGAREIEDLLGRLEYGVFS
jgi:putative toxin-antitoxin system antitoxin component (TIGR02293 family)